MRCPSPSVTSPRSSEPAGLCLWLLPSGRSPAPGLPREPLPVLGAGRGGGASPRAQPAVFLGPPHPLSALIHSQSARLSQTRWFQNRIVRCGHMSGTLDREARPLSVRMARVRPATQRLQPHFDGSIAQNHPVFPADPQPYWGAERDRVQRKRRLVL